jgi:hypothetical protein
MKGDINMSYEVRNVKTFMGMDSHGYNATLYRDGVKVAFVIEDGNGGESEIQWFDHQAPKVEVQWTDYTGKPLSIRCTPEEAKLYEFIRGKTWDSEVSGKFQMNIGMFVSELVDEFENAKRFKRICKDKTLFRIKGDKADVWRTIKAAFSKRVKDFIVGKYGDQVDEILNEKLGQVAA